MYYNENTYVTVLHYDRKPRNNEKGKQIDYFFHYIRETRFALNANQYFKDVENEFFPRTFNDMTLIRLNFYIKLEKQ